MSKHRDSKLKLIIIIAAVLVILITSGLLIYLNGIGAVDKKNDELISVNIPSGSGASSIVYILDENGLIKNMTFAKIHARIGGYNSLQANTYMFSKSMSLPEIMKAINTGDFEYISKQKFTIVEGATIPQAAAAIAEELPFTKEEIVKKWANKEYLNKLIDEYWFITDDILKEGIMYPLEGYIYPETYFITDEDLTIEEVTAMLLSKTDEELSARKDQIKDFGMSIHEFLTFSSIVVWEAGTAEDSEAEMIAGVFMNRLKKGMPFESDATVNYVHEERTLAITYSQLESDSLYNTYKHVGIPIGPICAVPARTMDAVLNYADHDYLYFFQMEDGEIIFNKTFEAHSKVARENNYY